MTWADKKPKKGAAPALTADHFFKASEDYTTHDGLKVMAWGGTGIGKTHFALSAPGPVYVLDTEFGTMPLLRHFKDKEIYVMEAAVLDPETDEPDMDESLKKIEAAIATLRELTAGTIVIDSGSDVWGWLGAWTEQQARKRGKMTSADTVQRLEWGRANARWRHLILRLMAKPMHFIITAQEQEIYDGSGRPTNTFRPRIQKQTEHMCDIILHIQKVYSPGKVKPDYVAKILKNRFQRGVELEIKDITFDKLCKALKDKFGIIVDGANIS